MTTVAPLPPAIPSAGPAPSLTPSRKRRLSLKALTAPFRRSERNDPRLPNPSSPSAYNPLDHPNDFNPQPARPPSKASSIFSKKLRRKSLVNLGRSKKEPAPEEVEQKTVEEKERPRSAINWQKRMANEPLPSEAANIRAAWLHQQHRLETMYPPQIAIELDPRGSFTSVGEILFPSSAQSQNLQVFVSQAPTSPGDYSTYAPSTASSQRDDLLRTMAQPFPSRPPSQTSGMRRQSLSMTSATPETESLPFQFPVPPPRQSDLPTPPASPHGYVPPLEPQRRRDSLLKREPAQQIGPDTPPHTPQRTSYHEGSGAPLGSTPARQNSLVSAVDFATTSPANPRRPLSLVLGQNSGTIPIFTRGTSPFHRLGHGRSASAALPSNSSSTSSVSNAGSTVRRPVSIAPQLGGRRMSASLASSGAFAPPGGSNRQSWASMQSQADSIGSSASAGAGTTSSGRNLVDEVRRRADERERRNNSRSMGHRRGDSNATITQDKAYERNSQAWQPGEADILEKENVAVKASPLRGASGEYDERMQYGAEAEALMGDMFSDERMQALVRELGI
ncbi:hypothetical protein JCM8097_001602 [Rhodosporidiobolus ruineniae]